MTPRDFPEANTRFHPPSDLEESQCRTIPAYLGTVDRGSVEGTKLVVVAWELSHEEVQALLRKETPTIYISMLGGLAPHFLSLSFKDAVNPT